MSGILLNLMIFDVLVFIDKTFDPVEGFEGFLVKEVLSTQADGGV